MDTETKIVLLGTGTPNPDPDRSGPCVAIVVGNNPFLVDLGPGVVRRAAAAEQAGIEALAVQNLKRALVTHLHSDHTAGYPDFILTPWVMGRNEPVSVYGPRGIRRMTRHLLEAYKQDIRVRVDDMQPSNAEGYKVIVHEIVAGIIYQDAEVTVKAFPVKHGYRSRAYGYRFETADRTIVLSGDTAPRPRLLASYEGCDVLIHEVYSQAGFNKLPEDWRRYHSNFHTSSLELAELANKVKPGLVILYHQLLFGTIEEELLDEIRSHYDGMVVFGNDLEVY